MMLTPQIGRQNRRRRGSACVELAILLPAYLLCFWGLLYLGWATLSASTERRAAAYIALQPGTQAADEILPQFFPWAGNIQSVGAAPGGGTEATTEDTVFRVNDAFITAEAFPQSDVDEALWTLALGELTVRTVVPPEGGDPQAELREYLDDAARYLRENSITSIPSTYSPQGPVRVTGPGGTVLHDTQPPPPGTTEYTRGVADALNAATLPGNWLERRQAHVEYVYEPPYLRRLGAVSGGPTPMTPDTYFSNAPEEGGDPLVFPADCRTAARGSAQRRGAGEPDMTSQELILQMRDLLQAQGSLVRPLSEDQPDLQQYWTPN